MENKSRTVKIYCQNCKANRAMRDLKPGWICLSCKAIHFIGPDNKIDFRLPKLFIKKKKRKEQIIINN